MRLALIVLIWLGAAASTPVTRKLQPVNDTVSAAAAATTTTISPSNSMRHKGKIEIQSPSAKVSKEDLISWITYAMRLMASKINITLATAEHDDSLPRENIEKLRNSSLLLNHFIDDLKEETKRSNATKSLTSAGFKVILASARHFHREYECVIESLYTDLSRE
ncbi:unnamed protein product [Trichogramma brassicae]|uniref:Uncharacterized protein n=1 Tax=Trichogramma brassicae TaxID=86971 RepID=A0A6H5IB88_9HYME|nr:unnamed protein product [Trichogramma brassicae]